MIQLGRFDELGSGVINIHKYLPAYADGARPLFEDTREGFRLTLPLKTRKSPANGKSESLAEVGARSEAPVAGEVIKLLASLKSAMSRRQIQEQLGLRHDEHFRLSYLHPALVAGLIEMTLPDKPTSRLQKYRLTAKGRAWLATQHPKPSTETAT